MSAAYKATVLKAADDIPAEGTLKEQAKYVLDQLEYAHPEIVWGVELVKFTTEKWEDTSIMQLSPNTSQVLVLWVGVDLVFKIFALKSLTDEAEFLTL